MTAIVDFYRGDRPDYLGRRLQDIWAWDNDRLELVHNYIQVLFPNQEESLFNPWAPLLDEETAAAFHADEQLRQNLAVSHDRLLRFYGLEYDPQTATVFRRPDFRERAANWISPGNHNYLRITRILKCLRDLGLPERARAFLKCLKEIHAEHERAIGPVTFDYWRNAVTPSGE